MDEKKSSLLLQIAGYLSLITTHQAVAMPPYLRREGEELLEKIGAHLGGEQADPKERG